MGLSVLKPGQSWANWDTLKLITNLEHSLSELKFNLQHSLREAIYSIVFTNTQCALDMPEFRSIPSKVAAQSPSLLIWLHSSSHTQHIT